MRAWKHFKTITHHRMVVMKLCFRVGLIWQGLTHDLSKYSWTEFRVGARYCTGDHSPNVEERKVLGYSTAWMHHKGRNKHHFEYWVDYRPGTRTYVPIEMPRRYLVEMCMDRIAACKTYHRDAYTDADALAYLDRSGEHHQMNDTTHRQLRYLLVMLKEHGEKETFQFIRTVVLPGKPFAEPIAMPNE